jgi:4-carboxymuconolactone decarboxylase
MKHWTAALCLTLVIAIPGASRTEENVRFPPLSPEQLTPEQKAWADSITAPPRNAKFTNAPYRAYIRNPDLAPRLTAMTDYFALEDFAAAAIERICDPDHGSAVDGPI